MIAINPPGVKPDADDVRIPPSHPRIVAFACPCRAIDLPDPAANIPATRELHRLGLSVVLLSPRHGQRGSR